MKEFIVPIEDDEKNMAHRFIGAIRAQTELIRCKDCKYVGTDATCFLVCDRDGMGLRPFHVYHDDYCSYGERKEE